MLQCWGVPSEELTFFDPIVYLGFHCYEQDLHGTEWRSARNAQIISFRGRSDKAKISEARENCTGDDINTGASKGPRVQRLAVESGVPEKDVLLFVAEFEAMRESTARIASGEDPDKVNLSLGEGKGNRSQRRAIAKAQKKAAKKGSLP